MVDVVSDKQASDVLLLDISSVSILADFFLICTGSSERQIKAICEAVEFEAKALGRLPRGREGTDDSGWVLIDYWDIVLHVFSPEQRVFYALDQLWANAATVVHLL